MLPPNFSHKCFSALLFSGLALSYDQSLPLSKQDSESSDLPEKEPAGPGGSQGKKGGAGQAARGCPAGRADNEA